MKKLTLTVVLVVVMLTSLPIHAAGKSIVEEIKEMRAEVARLKAENEKLTKENERLQQELEDAKSGKPAPKPGDKVETYNIGPKGVNGVLTKGMTRRQVHAAMRGMIMGDSAQNGRGSLERWMLGDQTTNLTTTAEVIYDKDDRVVDATSRTLGVGQ